MSWLRPSLPGGQAQEGGGLQTERHFPAGIYQIASLQCCWCQLSKNQRQKSCVFVCFQMGEGGSHEAQFGLEATILLPLPSESWN